MHEAALGCDVVARVVERRLEHADEVRMVVAVPRDERAEELADEALGLRRCDALGEQVLEGVLSRARHRRPGSTARAQARKPRDLPAQLV